MFKQQNEVIIQSRQHFKEICNTGVWNPVKFEGESVIFTRSRSDELNKQINPFWFKIPYIVFLEGRKSSKVDGIIYHVSRCGSTLLSKSLDQLNDVSCFNEPALFNQLIIDQNYNKIKDCTNRLTVNPKCIIKTSSWNICKNEVLRSCFPDAKIIFLYRDPFDILVSFNSKENGWINDVRILKLFGDEKELIQYDTLQRFARCLSTMFDIGSRLNCVRIDYDELLQKVTEGLKSNPFDYVLDEETVSKIIYNSKFNAKTGETFVPDSELKKQNVTEVLSKIPAQLADQLKQQYLEMKASSI